MIAGIPGRAARTRNPYSRSWLWIPGLRPVAHPGMTRRLLLRRALDKRLAALHLVGERRFVDLDHDRIGVDAEVFHQRLRDVAHHAGLLLVGAAGGHAHGNFRHFFTPFSLATSFRCEPSPHPEEPRILHRCHHPRKRMIQYSAPFVFNFDTAAYWMPAFAG